MRVLIFEPNFKGHYYAYLSIMIPALARAGAEVTLATSPDGRASAEYRTLLEPIQSDFTVDPSVIADAAPGFTAAIRRAGLISEAIRRAKADHAIVTHTDRFASGLLARRLTMRPLAPRGVETQGLFFTLGLKDPGTPPTEQAKARRLWQIARRTGYTHAHHLDPRVYQMLADAGNLGNWSLMPDPVESPPPTTTAQARRTLGIPEEGRFVGCAGVIDRRKGADLLINAFASARRGEHDRLLLVGPQEPFIRESLASPHAELVRQGRIISIDRFVAPADLAASICAMDLVATPYPKHLASASIVIRAAAAGRPVLGASFGWVGDLVPALGLGWTCDVENPEEFARELPRALERASTWTVTPAAKRFVQFHSPENFAACWSARVRERLGKPALERVDWASVLKLTPDGRISSRYTV
ncbi:MAG: glycosyltransferase [Phycisphaerales bacterium]|nr:glycosyltransferase [Phycisphaerales bacterium]